MFTKPTLIEDERSESLLELFIEDSQILQHIEIFFREVVDRTHFAAPPV
jgi:hypothetical protein